MSEKIPDCINFGLAVRRERSKQGYSQESFARKVGIHRTYLGGLERGERNPTLVTMVKIARELGVSLEDLFRFENANDE